MKSLPQVVMERELLKRLKCLLCKCPYGYHKEADKKGTKPEYLLRDYLCDGLKKDYDVTKEWPMDVKNIRVNPTISEYFWEIDLCVEKENKLLCLIELKYDEEYQDGKDTKSTNSQSEDEILRDAYKLQCLKDTFKNALCLTVFATNKSSHWKAFASIPSGEHTITYNGEQEKFTLLRSHAILWNEAMDSKYKYCIVSID